MVPETLTTCLSFSVVRWNELPWHLVGCRKRPGPVIGPAREPLPHSFEIRGPRANCNGLVLLNAVRECAVALLPLDPLFRCDIRLIVTIAAPSPCRLREANGTRLSSVRLGRTGCCAMVVWEAVALMRPPQSGVRSAASSGLDLQTATVALDQTAGPLHACTP